MKGQRLGAYLIDRELGSGGMGQVYAATGSEGVVALKVVHPHLMEQAGFFKRFLREAQVGQSVEHENVVRTLDCDAVGGHHFLVMEYVEGQTLAELQAELERVPEELCRHVGREICKGLAAIHDAGVVHRDLKPENVLITPDHVVKVMDLGVAHLAGEQMRLSQTGAFVGSVEYAAPEQFTGKGVDARTDLHALGLLLYEIACGVHPFRDEDFRTVMHRVCNEEPRRIGEIHPQLSPFFEEVVHTLLAKSADERFASAEAVLDVLGRGEESAWWRRKARDIQATTRQPLRRIRIPRDTAVYGREGELGRLRALYEQAKAGEGRVVLIEGEAGIGKSRLVDELVGRLQQSGEELNFLFGSYPPGAAATAAGGFTSAYREHFGDVGASAHLAETPLLVPAFDAVLRGEPRPEDAIELNRDALATCFVHATRSLASERPTIVLIDDLHFAPAEARALFATLSPGVAEQRVLLVGTTRPGLPDEWLANLARVDHCELMRLDRLSGKDVAALLVDAFASRQLADELGMKVIRKSDCNPFFVFEILRGLREGSFITRTVDGSWISTRVIDEIAIPSSVLDLVGARVSGLTPEEREVLDVGACIGFEFDAAVVAAVTGHARIPTLRMLSQIERAHRLVRAQGRLFAFDHHQVQEALYGSLPEMLREEYHSAIADALERGSRAAERDPDDLHGALCVDLAEHFLKGARGESALRYVNAALDHLLSGLLIESASELTATALAVPNLVSGASRVQYLRRQARLLQHLGRPAAARQALDEALHVADSTGDTILRGQSWYSLAMFLLQSDATVEAADAFDRATSLARGSGDTITELWSGVGSAFVTIVLGDHDSALRDCRALRQRAAALAAPGLLAAIDAQMAGALAAAGLHDQALEYSSRTVEWCRTAAENPWNLAVHLGNHATKLRNVGRLADARAVLNEAVDISRRCAYRGGVGWLVDLGELHILFGDLEEAAEMVRVGAKACEEAGERRWMAFGSGYLAVIADERGDSASATRMYEAAENGLRTLGLDHMSVRFTLMRARCLAGSGRADEAIAAVDSALRHVAADDSLALFAAIAAAELAPADVEELQRLRESSSGRLDVLQRMHSAFRIWRLAPEPELLAEAKSLLDTIVSNSPQEYRASMLQNVRLHREITDAWDQAHGPESVTRAGA